MKNIYKALFISLMIGLSSSIIFSYLFADGDYHPLSPESTMGIIYYQHLSEPIIMLLSIIIWMLIGLLFLANSYIFNSTDWSITKATMVHFICSYFPFSLLAILAGWFPLRFEGFISFTITFIIFYIVIWSISYIKTRKEIIKINQQLKNLNSK